MAGERPPTGNWEAADERWAVDGEPQPDAGWSLDDEPASAGEGWPDTDDQPSADEQRPGPEWWPGDRWRSGGRPRRGGRAPDDDRRSGRW